MLKLFSNKSLISVLEVIINKRIISLKKINQGYYGYIYLVEIDEKPYKYIAKVYKNTGYIDNEEAQLNEIRKYSLAHVPEIFGKSNKEQNGICDILLLEYINGVNASQIKISSQKEKARLSDEIVDNLISLHSVSNTKGFGDFVCDDYFSSWESYYKRQIDSIYSAVQKSRSIKLSSASKEAAGLLWNSFYKVFRNPVKENSLIHGDYNLWNLMVDPKSNHLTGIIDPMGCCYADRELDLFQLENANGSEYGLLDNYAGKVKLSDNFEIKNAYYRFWDDMKHFVNAGYCDNKLFKHYGQIVLNLLN